MKLSAVRGPRLRTPMPSHPAQAIVLAFGVTVLLGTMLLALPLARSGPAGAPLTTALFTATSAVCVTGLVVVDTPTYWSGFGEAVILTLIQVGGFGIMTLASLLVVLVSRRMGLRSRLTAATETKAVGIGDVRTVLLGVLKVTAVFESLTAVALTARFALGYDQSFWRATYNGTFHAVSAFNNAGFALWSDSLVGFAEDPWVCGPIALAVIAGGLGFPVLLELRRSFWSPADWSLHTKLTVTMTAVLILGGSAFITATEWRNPATLGGLHTAGRLLAGFFGAVMPRTAGFNSVDMAELEDSTVLGTMVLMFIGGGSASTAGGIKVTTFVVLLLVIWAEVRGEPSVTGFDRRISDRVQRQALTVALLGLALVTTGTLVISGLTTLPLMDVLFEVTSAFATVGLSTGITADLPTAAQLVLAVLMFVGRLGPITFASAIALRDRQRLYRLPEGRPIIG
jgi:trk system potassium uptake protein